MRKAKLVGGVVGVLVLLGAGVAWVQREPILAWHYIRQLARAGDADRATWVERIARLDHAAVPGLVNCLASADPQTRANAQTALVHLARRWGGDDPRCVELVENVADQFSNFGPPSQQAVLELAAAMWPDAPAKPADGLVQAAGRILQAAQAAKDPAVRGGAMELAAVVAGQGLSPDLLAGCAELARTGLRDADPRNRVRAVQLAVRPGINLLADVIPLLNDPTGEVRQACLLAVGPEHDVIATDDLFRWLHDPDADVRRLCERALRRRGLREDHVKLGRFMSDPNARIRLQVLDVLEQTADLEPVVWLRRLSHDPAPAVRAAAIRAAVEQPFIDLTDRIEQMTQNDPSPTIRQLAQYYLSSQKASPSLPRKP